MHFDILTLFPEMFTPLTTSMLGRAVERGIIDFNFVDIRDHSNDKHKRVDDYSFGGGPGMVMMADPVFGAMESVNAAEKKVLYMSPRGKTLNIDKLRELKEEKELVILCGHYEGVDQRVLDFWDVEEVSVGDYILTGGELPAMVLVDAVSRLVPGVLSCDESAMEESIYSGLLEFPQYTRPREYRGMETPEVLLGGDHGKVDMWRFEQALILTRDVRPDLFDEYVKNHGDLGKDRNKVMEKVLKML